MIMDTNIQISLISRLVACDKHCRLGLFFSAFSAQRLSKIPTLHHRSGATLFINVIPDISPLYRGDYIKPHYQHQCGLCK